MKLLINLCGHDGIISHYNGVGTMLQRYILTLHRILEELNIDYDLNLFTPVYNEDSFGYNGNVEKKHKKMKNTSIYQISNGSDGKINYGTIDNWKQLCENTSKIINSFDKDKYDKILTIYNDTPFACLANYLNIEDNHKTVLILHSTIKIHEIDSAIENSELFYNDRLEWEYGAVRFINQNKNSFMGVIGEFITKHLIEEYNLEYQKIINIYNGELSDKEEKEFSTESKILYNKIKNEENIILAFGRAEKYKNLAVTFEIGKKLGITPVVITQLYYKDQPIAKEYKMVAKENNGILYIDPPFDFAKYILNNFEKNMICLIPSKREVQGLIVNEIRKLNKPNILIVSNGICGLKEQIQDGYDGIVVDLDDLNESLIKIKKYFNSQSMREMNFNSQKTLYSKFNLYDNVKKFIISLLK